MTQPAKSHEPSMEEILASIRRIIADDDVKPEASAAPVATPAPPPAPAQPKTTLPPNAPPKPAPVAPAPQPKPAPPPAPAAKAPEPKPAPAPAPAATPNNQDDIDALLAGLDADTSEDEVRSAPAAVAEPEPAEEDVLELTEQMEVAEEEPQSFKTIHPNDDIEFSEAAEPKPAEPRLQERPHVPVPPPVRPFEESEPTAPQQPLMSQNTATAVNSAFNALAQTVLSNNARTLEDLVKEMLRPMLRSWLDDNLPGLVEKIVRAEIERVSRGR
jgi:cell pole-organizing protein PopZ